MALTPSTVTRSTDATGDEIATFDDGSGNKVQAVALVDVEGAHAGVSAAPVHVQGSVLTAIEIAVEAIQAAVEILDNIVLGARGLMTEDNSAAIEGNTRVLGANDVEEASDTLSYVGLEQRDGTWVVQTIDTSSGTSIRYATVANNAGVADYATAWAARASLVYGIYGEAF